MRLQPGAALRRFVSRNDIWCSRDTIPRTRYFVGYAWKASKLGRRSQGKVDWDLAVRYRALRDKRLPGNSVAKFDSRRSECQVTRPARGVGAGIVGASRGSTIGDIEQIKRWRAAIGGDIGEWRFGLRPRVQHWGRHHGVGRATGKVSAARTSDAHAGRAGLRTANGRRVSFMVSQRTEGAGCAPDIHAAAMGRLRPISMRLQGRGRMVTIGGRCSVMSRGGLYGQRLVARGKSK